MTTPTITAMRKKTSRTLNLNCWCSIFALCIFACVLVGVNATPSPDEELELANTRQCKALCKQCGGLGFYCGEECICECNNDRSDTECIVSVQRDARKLKLPFEILIQGPGKSNFVRNALQFEQNADRRQNLMSVERNKRSTVVIYKPNLQNTLYEQSDVQKQKAEGGGDGKPEAKIIKKRSVNQFEWFNELANTLLRPAPIRVVRDNDESEDSREQDRPTKFNPSWFMNSAKMPLRPAPLFRRRSDRDQENTERETTKKIRKETPPLKAAAVNDGFGEALLSKILEGTDELQTKLQSNDFSRFLRDVLSETLKKIQPNSAQSDESETETEPEPDTETETESQVAAAKFPRSAHSRLRTYPWFSPMRFLERVKEAINKKEAI